MPKISVSDKVLAILKSSEWVASSEIERLFPAGEPGHFSWSQRIRGLREPQNGGYTITHRIKAGTKNLSEWHLTPQAPQNISTEASFVEGKSTISPKMGNDAFSDTNSPQAPKSPEIAYFERNRQLVMF